MDYSKLFALCLCSIAGFMIVSYQPLAVKNYWPVGKQFDKSTTFVGIWGTVLLYGSVILSPFILQWWSFVIVFLAGIVIGPLLVTIFKHYSQIVSIVLAVIAFVLANIVLWR